MLPILNPEFFPCPHIPLSVCVSILYITSIHGPIPLRANQPGQTDRRPDEGDDNIKIIKL